MLDKPAAGLALVEFEAEMRRGSELFASLDRIDLIKCDIEGYELVVMTEMRPLLERHHPTVLIETRGEITVRESSRCSARSATTAMC